MDCSCTSLHNIVVILLYNKIYYLTHCIIIVIELWAYILYKLKPVVAINDYQQSHLDDDTS